MRFYLMDWHQTLLSFFIGVVGGGWLPICLMFVFIAIYMSKQEKRETGGRPSQGIKQEGGI
jgi:hypothetical protein